MQQKRKKKGVAILGSTGSIGTQTLEVIALQKEFFSIEVLTAGRNADLLIEQAKQFLPNTVVIGDESLYDRVFQALDPLEIKVFAGEKSIASIVEMHSVDVVLTALVGFSGLIPTIRAIQAGKTIALANKETLVVAGELITKLALEHKVAIYPVDSEHSAIFQCLSGEYGNPIEKLILTASGGPFRGFSKEQLQKVTKAQALKHPNWAMGAKITIDSASMMNKGLEVIEAKWLFDVTPQQIEVVVHPQSIVHSLVQFTDGSIKAQLGLPDMRLPIQFALGYPDRLPAPYPRFNFSEYPSLTFEQPDPVTFKNLALSFQVLEEGGNKPCILNAANEIAVQAFLEEKIGFLEMSDLIEFTLQQIPFHRNNSIEDYLGYDAEARKIAHQYIEKFK